MTKYVLNPDWSSSTTDGAYELSFDFNNRMYISDSSTVDPDQYFTVNLLGGIMEFDIDLSLVGCSCLTALYTITMPGVDNTWDPFKYCDASGVGGHYCPEFDVMEANKYAFQVNAHSCVPTSSGAFYDCSYQASCSKGVYSGTDSYGPSTSNSIDSQYPFHMKMEFHENATTGQFEGYTTTLTQGSQELVFTSGVCDFLNNMTEDMKRMVIAISNWSSGDMSWLNKGSCSEGCNTNSVVSVFSNLSI